MSWLDRLDVFEFLTHVQNGLKDHYDIKMLTYLMVARVAQLCPAAVLAKLDKLVEPLRATVTTKVKANAVKQEYEKQDELKRSAMRAVAALMTVPGAGKGYSFDSCHNVKYNVLLLFRQAPAAERVPDPDPEHARAEPAVRVDPEGRERGVGRGGGIRRREDGPQLKGGPP